MHHRGNHYSQPKFYTHMGHIDRDPCPCDECQRRNRTNSHKLVVNPQLDAHARGDDDDSRQIIADLLSSDDSPFTPDDEIALRNLSGATLKEMRRKFLKHSASAVANSQDPAFNAMSAGMNGLAGADFHARANERKRMSDDYNKRNPVARRDNVVTAHRDDPSFQAMNSGGLADALRNGGK